MEFYNFDGELFKVIETKATFQMKDGKYMIKNMVASNLKTGRKSEILFNNISEGSKVDDSVFSLQNLQQ
jgi:translation elongation factor P/translation initiation factor 5A